MEVVFIDSEPPGLAGGGIRTYLSLTMQACRERGIHTRIYTHNPFAYPGETAIPIGRTPVWPRVLRRLAYRFQYSENVLWEHSYWLAQELASFDSPEKVYEFADFLGYGYFTLRKPAMVHRTLLRVHTPNFLVVNSNRGLKSIISRWQCTWREKECLRKASRITVPSAEFVKEKLPWLKNWKYLPNPLPPKTSESRVIDGIIPTRMLYLGRVEPRKGVLQLVRAFLTLAATRKELSLTLVGNSVPGPYARKVRAIIDSQLPEIRCRLTWEPPCPADMRLELFARFQLLVVPSLWENSPYVYFEGMAAGLLCVGTSTGEMKAVAQVTGNPMVQKDSVDDWVRTLETVTTRPHSEVMIAQTEYLRSRRADTLNRLIANYLEMI